MSYCLSCHHQLRRSWVSIFSILIIFLFSLTSSGCLDDRSRPIENEFVARQSADWVTDAVIYEVYLRSFSPEGTFEGLRKRIPELKDLGVTVLWLMPIHPVGEDRRKGTLGSPYSVKDYFDVNPEFGTFDDFKLLLEDVRAHDMKLILDLVANHTAWDNRLIHEHPDWYVQDEDGNIVYPAGTDWWDVADLDYSNPEVWEYMKEVMRYWVEDVGVDGFRCDVSELVPLEFWEEARRMLDDIKPVMMLSEGTMPEHHLYAFDITYSWNIYHNISPIVHGDEPAALLDKLLAQENDRYPQGALRLRFSSNHDENAWDAPAVEKWGRDGAKAVAVLVTTISGVPLIYNGDEVGNEQRLHLFERVPIDWTKGAEYREFYTELFSLYDDSFAFRRGDFAKVNTTNNAEIYSFLCLHEQGNKLVIINLKPNYVAFEMSANLVLDAVSMQSSALRKRIGVGDDIINVSYDDVISMSLPKYGFVVYEIR